MGRASLPDDLKARVLSAARQEPSPARRAVIAGDTIVLSATTAAVLNLVLASGGILASQALERWYVPAAWAVVAGASTWIALGRGKSMLGRRKSVLVAVNASGVLACIGVATIASSWAAVTNGSGARSLLIGTLASMIILAGLIYARRGSELRHPHAAGAALGAASASWAALLVELNQPAGAFLPAVLAHLSPMLIAMALGYVVGGRVIVGLRQ